MAVVMFAIVGAGFFAVGALRDSPPAAIAIGDGVSLTPSIEWQFVARDDPPAGGSEGVLLTRGVGSLLVFTSPLAAEAQLGQLRDELAERPMLTTGPIAASDVRPAQAAFHFPFSGVLSELSAAPLEGDVTAVQGGRVSVVVVAWADVGEYNLIRDEVEAMIVTAVVP